MNWDCLTLAVHYLSRGGCSLTGINIAHKEHPLCPALCVRPWLHAPNLNIFTPDPLPTTQAIMNIYEFMDFFFFVCVCACSLVSDSLWPHELLPSRLLSPWDFLGKNTGMCCHFLLQGFFPTQGLNPYPQCLLHHRHFIHHWAKRETHVCFYIVSILVPKKVDNWLQHPNLCRRNVSQCCCFFKKALTGTEL